MRLLIDTNVFFEILFKRQRVEEARALLAVAEEHDLFISDFSLHSVGYYLFNGKQQDAFIRFLKDQILSSRVRVLVLGSAGLENVAETSKKTGLDFDDAYQYTVAEKNDLTLVSFDKDFDKTERGKKTPAEILTQKS